MTRLDRYIAAAALRAFILVAIGLTALFSLLEFVNQLSSVGQGNYHVTSALTYVALTVPSRLLQVTPASMLLGCLLALGALAKNSEITALQSLGISERRIIAAVLKLTIPITAVLFLMAQFIIPPAQQLAQTQRASALSASTVFPSDGGFWAHGDHEFLDVQHFEYWAVPSDIDIYSFADDGSLKSYIHADRASIRPNGAWLLSGVLIKTVAASQFQTQRLASLCWQSFVSPQRMQFLMLPPESMPPVALYQYVRDFNRQDQPAIRYKQELWTKLCIPLSMAAMILIAAPFAFWPPRQQSTGLQITIGAVLGIVFSLAQQIAGYLGVLLDLSPAVTAMTPSLLLMALAAYLFRYKYGV